MPDESKGPSPPNALSGLDPSIQQAVMDLGIARRTLLIYPPSHDQVKRSLKRAHQSLITVLDQEASITLTVMKDGLAVNDRPLESKAALFADLSAVFKQYQIAALSISKGLGLEELVRFLAVIIAERDKIMARGGIAAVFDKQRLDHIQIRVVDYSKLHMTEESEIQRSAPRESDGSLWQAFVADLLKEEDPPSSGGRTASDINTDPGALAALLNQRMMTPGKAIAHYERVMVDAAEGRTQASSDMSAGLAQFQQMIKELYLFNWHCTTI
jgi:hypothetical protein